MDRALSGGPAGFRIGPFCSPARGLIDLVGFGLAVPAATVVWTNAAQGALAIHLYGLTLCALFFVSATYHSLPWAPFWKRALQRADHVTIYLHIAATACALAELGGYAADGWLVLSIATVAALGVARKLLARRVCARAGIPAYSVIAALGLLTLPAIVHRFPAAEVSLAFLAAAASGVGAFLFAIRRPVLWPPFFSYHELFHVLVIIGNAATFALVVSCLLV